MPLRIASSDPVAVEAAIVKSEELQRQLWAIAEDAARPDSSDVTALFVESINDVITVHEQRVTAGVYARVPPTILWVLVLGSALSLGMVGYSAGITTRRSPVTAIALVVALGAVLTLTVDLDRPAGRLHPGEPAAADRPAATDRRRALKGDRQVGYPPAAPDLNSRDEKLRVSDAVSPPFCAPEITTPWSVRVEAPIVIVTTANC